MVLLDKKRPQCPLYGFNAGLDDTRGNGCPLEKGGHHPCQMEMVGETPDWDECRFNIGEKGNLDNISEYRIFPDEFRPKKKVWKGLRFSLWREHVKSLNETKH